MEEHEHIGKEIPPGKIYLMISPLRTIVCSRKEKRASVIEQQTGGNFRSDGYVVDSGSNLPPIPAETCHPFRFKPATHSGRNFTTYKAFSGMRKNVVYSKKI